MNTFFEKYCNEEWLSFINFHKEEITFKKGEYIFHTGEETKGLFVIDSGKVKVTYLQYDGSQRLIRLATNGDILGHRGLGGNWTYPISAIALEDVTASLIPTNIFKTVAKTNPEFSFNLMMFFADELRHSEAKIKHYPAKNRVARAILHNYQAFGVEDENKIKLSYTLSRKDIASKAGTTYETVIRTIAELKKAGIIKTESKSISITNLKQLEEIANPEHLTPED